MSQPQESTSSPALPVAFKEQNAHDNLLQEWLDWTGSMVSLAHQHGLTLDQFIAWFRLEQTQARIHTLAAIADARAFLLAKLHRAAAIERLSEIAESTREANIRDRIRAGTQILRTAQIADDREQAAAAPSLSGPSAIPRPIASTPDQSPPITSRPAGGAEPLVACPAPRLVVPIKPASSFIQRERPAASGPGRRAAHPPSASDDGPVQHTRKSPAPRPAGPPADPIKPHLNGHSRAPAA
jgi:hypothetical protein